MTKICFDSFCIAALCVLECFGVISASEIRVSRLLGWGQNDSTSDQFYIVILSGEKRWIDNGNYQRIYRSTPRSLCPGSRYWKNSSSFQNDEKFEHKFYIWINNKSLTNFLSNTKRCRSSSSGRRCCPTVRSSCPSGSSCNKRLENSWNQFTFTISNISIISGHKWSCTSGTSSLSCNIPSNSIVPVYT